MIFKWRKDIGDRFQVDPEDAGNEIARIADGGGGTATAQAIVEASEPKDSVLHACFEWDNDKAASLHRQQQARNLVGALVYIEESPSGEERTVRAFVHTSAEEGYSSLARVMSDTDLRARLIAKAWAELQGWERRYQDLTEFAEIFSVIRKAG